jgi:hypothetical protein
MSQYQTGRRLRGQCRPGDQQSQSQSGQCHPSRCHPARHRDQSGQHRLDRCQSGQYRPCRGRQDQNQLTTVNRDTVSQHSSKRAEVSRASVGRI